MNHAGICLRIAICILIAPAGLSAQKKDTLAEKIADKIEWYSHHQPAATLFVHYDKNIYTNNENVWFTGYLVNPVINITDHFALSVALVRNEDRSVFAADKFLMSNGLSFGNIFLPDSLPPGNYTLIAYTNHLVNGNPDNVFIQPVTIKSGETKFTASLKLVDSVKASVDSVRVLLAAYTKDIRLIADATVKYWMGDSLHQIISANTKTDRKGEVMIMVPVKKITSDNFILTAEIQYGKELKTMHLRFPVYRKKPIVTFYPEGGNMIDGTQTIIGCESKNAEGEPLSVNAILYKKGQPVDTFQTNSYGMGRFKLIPEKQSEYTVKVFTGNDDTNMYPLPQVLSSGPGINIKNALANDTLHVQLTNSYAGKLLVMLHNYKETFSALEVITQGQATKKIDIDLADVPKGLTEITVFDSAGIPRAERIFFAHYDQKQKLNISTDSTEYGKRQKVQVTLKLLTDKGKPEQGTVSFACIQDNRIDVRKMTDIESYVYLKNELAALPFKHKPMNDDVDSKQYLEDVLLIKGWRKYTWPAVLQSTAIDTMQQATPMQFTGNVVSIEKKKIKKPLPLGYYKEGSLTTFDTDSSGNFNLIPDQTIMASNRNTLFVIGKEQKNYDINIKDPYPVINQKLATQTTFENYDLPTVEQNTQALALKGDEFTHILPQVVVKSTRKDYSIFDGTCSDYVCQYQVLNCPNHHFGVRPVSGNTYTIYQYGRNIPVIYNGHCRGDQIEGEHILLFKGIMISKEFYASDYAKFNPPDPEMLSTVYWSHSVLIKDGEATVTFYTGDIAGKFRIIVQGVTGHEDVVFGEQVFTVRAN